MRCAYGRIEMAGNSQRFCMELFIPSSESGGRQALIRQDLANARDSGSASIIGRLWEPGRTLQVRFLEGDPALRRRVQEYAEQWNEYANIRFAFVAEGDAEIRVAFVSGDASWSAVGTDALYFPKQAPTMNFGWLTPESSDEEVRAIVLHEFGHALGLIHEHQNPEAAIQGNEAAVISDLSQPPNNVTIEQIQHNVIGRYDSARSAVTSIDVDSIMRSPIPASWTHGTFSSDFYDDLSPTDKEFFRALYPGARDPSPPRPVMMAPDESFDFGISGAAGGG